MVDLLTFGAEYLYSVGSHFIFEAYRQDGLTAALYQRTSAKFFGGVLTFQGKQQRVRIKFEIETPEQQQILSFFVLPCCTWRLIHVP